MAQTGRAIWPVFLLGLLVGAGVVVGLAVLGPIYGVPVDRYLFGADNAESQKLDARIAELEDKLAKAEKDTAVPLDTRPAVDEEVARLKAQLGLAENVTTDLQTQLDKAQNEDIPALKAQIAERDATLKRFDEEIARLSSAEDELQHLKNEQAKQADHAKANSGELERLRGELSQRDTLLKQYDAELVRLSSVERELKTLREATANAQGGANPNAALQAEIDGLRQKLKREGEAEAERRAEIVKLNDEVAKRDAMLKNLDVEITRLSPLEQENDTLRKQLEEAKADDTLAELRNELDETRQRLKGLRDEVAERDGELQSLRDELARLNEANSDGGDEAPATRSTAPESASAPADSAPGQPASDRTPTPRDPLLVAGAMRQSRGLGDIPDNERDRIATGLIEGECVRDVLKEVFGTPPGDALNDLVGALDSDC